MKKEPMLNKIQRSVKNLERQKKISDIDISRHSTSSNREDNDVALSVARFLFDKNARSGVVDEDKHLTEELYEAEILKEWFGKYLYIIPKQVAQSFYVLWVEAGSPDVKEYCRKLASPISTDHLMALKSK